MILVPVKNLSGAKQRLAAILDQPARTKLAQAMLSDVLEVLAAWTHRPEVGIVTSDPFALQLANRYHFTVIPDNANRSETVAIETATRFCESKGVDSSLVIPADIPLIQSWELEKIIAVAPTEGSVLVPAGDGRGTNAIFRASGKPFSRTLRQRQLQTSPRGSPRNRQALRRDPTPGHRDRYR